MRWTVQTTEGDFSVEADSAEEAYIAATTEVDDEAVLHIEPDIPDPPEAA